MTKAKILIVDDEVANVKLLKRLLAKAGYSEVFSTMDSREALPLYAQIEPDLVLLDLNMPHPDGFEILEQLKEITPADSYVPVLILTGDINIETKKRALAGGAKDFLTKPFDATEVLLRIGNLIETRLLHKQLHNYSELLQQKVQQALQELKAAQSQVIQQERMHALGLMARGVAHDFNNALAVVLGFGELALEELRRSPGMEEAAKFVNVILMAASDASKIVDRLREFHHPPEEEHNVIVPVDLSALADQAVSFTKPRWCNEALGRQFLVKIQNESEVPPVIAGEPAELREALINLIFNAIDAMPQGGNITLRICTETDHIVLQVSDTGTGMSEETRKRCLEPFFTTKGKRGTGLGLAMVYGIVQRHLGTVSIESELGKGTTFTLQFPAKIFASSPMLSIPKLDRPLRVLMVDGHPVLSDLAAQYLEQDGHTVERVTTGEDAIDKIKSDGFDLLITGEVLPGMNGDQIAVSAKSVNPNIPVIMLTGFGEESGPDPKSVDLVLRKPISRKALRRALREITTTQAETLKG